MHWRLPAKVLRPLVPPRLELDTWEGDAWLGIVAFRMSGVRPWWFPALPRVSAFAETNLRTYVHCQGDAPGVLFLSLDAANRLAVRVARRRWRLPYYHARMTIDRRGDVIEYHSRRDSGSHAGRTHFLARLDSDGDAKSIATRHAEPGSLEFFLAERYWMYVPDLSGNGLIRRGQVHHSPYPLVGAELLTAEESLSSAAGLPPLPAPCHAMFSPGVSVEVFGLSELV